MIGAESVLCTPLASTFQQASSSSSMDQQPQRPLMEQHQDGDDDEDVEEIDEEIEEENDDNNDDDDNDVTEDNSLAQAKLAELRAQEMRLEAELSKCRFQTRKVRFIR